MSSRKLPAYLRYLKARVQPFGRPVFWASAVGLLLVLLFAWEYWNDPEWFSAIVGDRVAQSDKPTAEPTLSSKELAAIGADIDSSSVLLNEIDRTNALSPVTLPTQPSATPSSDELLSQLTRPQAEADSKQKQKSLTLTGTSQQKPNATNPFATSAQEYLNTSPLFGSDLSANLKPTSKESSSSIAGATANPTLGFNSLNSLNTNRGAVPGSQLPNPLNRATSANSPTTANTSQMPVNQQTQALPTPTYQRQMIYPPATAPGATGYNSAGQITYPPTTAPGATGYNSAGQITYPPATAPGATSYNSAGQITYPPATVTGSTGYNSSPITPTTPLNSSYLAPSQPVNGVPTAIPVTPVVPITPSNGQYSTQPSSQVNGITNPRINSTQQNPGLQPSQLSQPNFTVPSP